MILHSLAIAPGRGLREAPWAFVCRNLHLSHQRVQAGNYTLSGLTGFEVSGKTVGRRRGGGGVGWGGVRGVDEGRGACAGLCAGGSMGDILASSAVVRAPAAWGSPWRQEHWLRVCSAPAGPQALLAPARSAWRSSSC